MKDGAARRKLEGQEQEIISMSHRLRHCEEMIAKQGEVRKRDGLAELEGRFLAYIDAYYNGRQHLFDGMLADAVWEKDVFTLFRQVTDLAVSRWYRIRELEEQVGKLRAETRKT